MGPLRKDTDLLRRRVRAGLDALAAVPGVDRGQLGATGYASAAIQSWRSQFASHHARPKASSMARHSAVQFYGF